MQLLALDYDPTLFEIIIIDNNSTDRTKKTIRSLQKAHRTIRYLFEPRQGRTFASLAGIRAARSQHVVFIDDDIQAPAHLLQTYSRYFSTYPDAVVIGGPIRAQWTNSEKLPRLCTIIQKHMPWIFGELSYGTRVKKLRYPEALFAGNMAVNLNAFSHRQEVFSDSLGRRVGKRYLYAEDYELCLRLGLEKKSMLYVPELAVVNTVERERATLGYIVKRLIHSGIERYIIDKNLASYVGHVPLAPNLSLSVQELLKRPSLYALAELSLQLPIWYGYHAYGPSVEKTARTQGIISRPRAGSSVG